VLEISNDVTEVFSKTPDLLQPAKIRSNLNQNFNKNRVLPCHGRLLKVAASRKNWTEATYPQLVLITAVRPAGIPAGHSVFAGSPKE
jgi:hypothetical protein